MERRAELLSIHATSKDREVAQYLLTKALRGENRIPNIVEDSGKILQFALKR